MLLSFRKSVHQLERTLISILAHGCRPFSLVGDFFKVLSQESLRLQDFLFLLKILINKTPIPLGFEPPTLFICWHFHKGSTSGLSPPSVVPSVSLCGQSPAETDSHTCQTRQVRPVLLMSVVTAFCLSLRLLSVMID